MDRDLMPSASLVRYRACVVLDGGRGSAVVSETTIFEPDADAKLVAFVGSALNRPERVIELTVTEENSAWDVAFEDLAADARLAAAPSTMPESVEDQAEAFVRHISENGWHDDY